AIRALSPGRYRDGVDRSVAHREGGHHARLSHPGRRPSERQDLYVRGGRPGLYPGGVALLDPESDGPMSSLSSKLAAIRPMVRNERGVALILALLITLAIAALAMGGVMLSSSGQLTAKFTAKEAALHSLADAGLEIARDSINRALTVLPDTGYIVVAP